MIQYGFESKAWMAKALIKGAHPTLLKRAVVDVIDHIVHADEILYSEEILDRLVQIASTGEYVKPEILKETVEDALRTANELLSDEDEEVVERFRSGLSDLPDGNDPFGIQGFLDNFQSPGPLEDEDDE